MIWGAPTEEEAGLGLYGYADYLSIYRWAEHPHNHTHYWRCLAELRQVDALDILRVLQRRAVEHGLEPEQGAQPEPQQGVNPFALDQPEFITAPGGFDDEPIGNEPF